MKIKTKNEKKYAVKNDKICSNPRCHHSSNDHYSTLRPKSAGDLLDTSCALCDCKKFEEWRFNLPDSI